MSKVEDIMALVDDYVEVYADRQALRADIEQALTPGVPAATVTSTRVDPDGVVRSGLDRELPLMTSVYTAPQPQREWVGLTNPERAKILAAIPAVPFEGDWHSDLIDAIEARLREKNGGAA